MAVQLVNELADAMLEAYRTYMNDGGGTATIGIYTTAFGTLLAEFDLDATTPWGTVGAGTSTNRKTSPVEGDGDFTKVGLADGTAAVCRISAESGARGWEGTVTVTGGGGDITVSNTSIATDQPVTLTGGNFNLDAALGAA